jgi:hypothetical protein
LRSFWHCIRDEIQFEGMWRNQKRSDEREDENNYLGRIYNIPQLILNIEISFTLLCYINIRVSK